MRVRKLFAGVLMVLVVLGCIAEAILGCMGLSAVGFDQDQRPFCVLGDACNSTG